LQERVKGTSNNDDFFVELIAGASATVVLPHNLSRVCSVWCRQAPAWGGPGTLLPLCGSHPFQRHQPADVGGSRQEAAEPAAAEAPRRGPAAPAT
jgi:hypothetical protein